MQQEKTCFFYEICNIWQSQGNAQKNLTCFFVFNNDKNDTFFKVPNLTLKIKTKSDSDNTEVKLWISYDNMPDLIYTIQNFLHNKQANRVSLAGNKYMFYISKYNTDQGEYAVIKLSDSNENMNDFIMSTATLNFITNTLEKACNDIINMSLNFIKIAQNHDIIEKLNSIEHAIRHQSVAVASSLEPSLPVGPGNSGVWYGSTPVATDIALSDNDVAPTITTDVAKETPLSEYTTGVETFIPISSAPLSPIDVDNAMEIKTSVDTPPPVMSNINEVATTMVKDVLNMSPVEVMKEKILTTIKHQTDPYRMLMLVFEQLSLVSGNPDISFQNASKYFYTTFASYEKYFRKLSLITTFFQSVTKKVPLFTIKTRLSDLYVKETQYLNEALVDLYLHYRETRNSPEDEYIYACLRYVFAPFWSSYIVSSSDITHRKPGFTETLKNFAITQLNGWEKVFEKQVDDFIYDNNLVIKYEGNIVDSVFSISCPTLFECLKEANENTPRENVDMIKDIISQLRDTYAYEEIIYKEWYNINALSDEFLKTLKLFSKVKNINKDSNMDQVVSDREAISKLLGSNILMELKALSAIDTHDGVLVKDADKPKSEPVSHMPPPPPPTMNDIVNDTKNLAPAAFDPINMIAF